MSDYESVREWVVQSDYCPQTSVDNLALMIMLHFDCADNYGAFDAESGCGGYGECFSLSECKRFVSDSGGFAEFDYEP